MDVKIPGVRLPLLLLCSLAAAAGADTTSSPATTGSPSSLVVEVWNAAGAAMGSQSDPQKATLIYGAAYQPGDAIVVSAPPQDKYLFVQVDDNVPESLVFTAYRNLALNSLDQRNVSQYFPHAIASSVTRDDPMFFERNAIDGNIQNKHHGKWPYESWGNGLNASPWFKIDFGREVTADKVRLYIRSDFPHDTYWTNATLQFSDGTLQDIVLQKTAAPQEFTFPEKKIRWIQFTNFKQPTLPLGFAALTEMEVYGKDLPQP